MKKTLLTIAVISAIFWSNQNRTFAQTRIEMPPVTCPAGFESNDLHIPPPASFLASQAAGRSKSNATAEIIVAYSGFEDHPEAQAAFQFAVDVWSTLITSDMPIYMTASFEDLGGGVLGSCGPSGFYRNFEGALNDSSYYAVALAEKMARRDFNTPGAPDMNARFNSTFTWYFGTDGNCPPDQYDFISTVLHEIAHGLGFLSLGNYESVSVASITPAPLNDFMVNGSGVSVYNIPNGTTQMANFYTSNDVYVNAPSAVAENGDQNVQLYAPNPYNPGSSLHHLGEIFNGTDNACMTYSGAPGEVIHHPGPIAVSLFEDMGWLGAKLSHDADLVFESFVDDIVLELDVVSDLAFEAGSDIPKVIYSFDGFATETEVEMADQGNGHFTYAITNPGQAGMLQYYFTGLTDALRSYTSPASVFNGPQLVNTHRKIIRDGSTPALPYNPVDGGDFESGAVFTSVPVIGNEYLWEHGTPGNTLNQPSSGTNAWKTGLNDNLSKPGKDYVSAMISPRFDLSDTNGDYNLSFDMTMDSQDGPMAIAVLYSTDGGVEWEVLGGLNDGRGENWYNKEIIFLPIIEEGWIFDNSADGPTRVSYSLTELLGNSEVYFAIVAGVSRQFETAEYAFDGVLIDDFMVNKTDPRANFISSASSGLNFPGETISFEFISSGADTYAWDFGDGGTSDLQNPTHEYTDGGEYDVSLTITYPGGTHTTTKSVVIASVVGSTYLLADGGDFESNFADFIADNISGTPWERGESSIVGKNGTHSGSNAWVTGLTAAEYVDQSEALLYTPLFDFSLIGDYELSFWANYNTEMGWDGFILEYTIDNGETWEQLDPEVGPGWYDVIGEDNPEQGWPAIPLFSGNTNTQFQEKSRDISFLAGNPMVGFRFHWLSDFAETVVGIAIDDFQMTGPTTGPAEANFDFSGVTGCDGQVITFQNASSGSITSMNWDFGQFADPATAEGPGPHFITYTGGEGSSSVTLTVESPVNGTQTETKTDIINTAALHTPTITEEDNGDHFSTRLVASQGDAYQWYLYGQVIEGATSQTYETSDAGDYSVEVTVNGCPVITSRLEVISSVEYIDIPEHAFTLHPNPTDGQLNLTLEHQDIGELNISIYSITGGVIRNYQFNKSSKTFKKMINVSDVEAGVYFIELTTQGSRGVKRLLLK